jgi:hypothetical protein
LAAAARDPLQAQDVPVGGGHLRIYQLLQSLSILYSTVGVIPNLSPGKQLIF